MQLICTLQRSNQCVPKTALGMAMWASDLNVSLDEACERARQFGDFIIHHQNQEDAKNAVRKYTKQICRQKRLPRYIRRDILFEASQYFLEPDFECFADDKIYSVYEDDALYDQAVAYNAADIETREQMRAEIDPEILKLLDGYYARAEHYRQNEQFIKELKQLEDEIECQKYGI